MERMSRHLRMALAAIALSTSGCSWLWPTMVRSSPEDPLFHSGFPLVGPARTDGAVCSLATIGPDATRLVMPPEPIEGAVAVEDACRLAWPADDSQRGRVGQLVAVTTSSGVVHGYLYGAAGARGLLVAFSGLGMPAAGWVNERFAELAARRRLATFAPVRDETARPIYFDPLREARRALDAALRISGACAIGASPDVRFVGLSMGGLEALLATREARGHGLAARAAVLDPVLDPERAADNLEGFWHAFAVDAMQAYFRRILRARYGEPDGVSFRDVMARVRLHPDAATELDRDAPSRWLCAADRDAYAVFVSDTDPVLGDAQREFAKACGLPLRAARAPGHVPLACRLELFEELLDAIDRGRVAPGDDSA